MSAPYRVLVAGLYHETNTFLDGLTPLSAFKVRRGAELFEAAGDGSPLAGFLEVAHAKGLDVVPSIDMRAPPSALVADEVVDDYLRHLEADLKATTTTRPLDAVFMVLHGAMVSESNHDVESAVLQRIAETLGEDRPPVFGVFDLHANLSGDITSYSDGLFAYQQNPHTDAHASAVRAAQWMVHALETQTRPRIYFRSVPIVWPPTGTGTDDEPMRSLQALARKTEAESSAVWSLSVVPGFAYADSPFTGLTLLAVATNATEAEAALDRLAAEAWDRRTQGLRPENSVASVLDEILPVNEGPILLVEPSDNIGGGAPGDSTGVLRHLVARDVSSALVAINDADAVKALRSVNPGQSVRLPIGGKGSRFDSGPLELDVELMRLSDGKFELEDRQSHMASMSGIHADMGPTAVVRYRGITLLLTSKKTPPFDLGQYRSQAIEPTGFDLIVVKAAVAHRRAYDPIAVASYWVATPGPCPGDITTLPYQRLPRDRFPFTGKDDSETT